MQTSQDKKKTMKKKTKKNNYELNRMAFKHRFSWDLFIYDAGSINYTVYAKEKNIKNKFVV